ncbi:MAG: HD domain-containing protein [Candidatus Firestonebacteria bacterium]
MELTDRYDVLKSKVINRKKEFDRFIEFIEEETTWLISPASTKYHLNREKGLLEHSLNVTDMLLKLKETLAPRIDNESCIIVGLFHDAGKLGFPGKPYYIPNENKWEAENRNIKYKINPSLVTMGIAVRSLYLVSKYISLSDEEAQAIVYHDGQYITDNASVKHKEVPLTLLVHFADLWASSILEK